MKKITVLIPAYNEAENIPELLDQLDKLTKNEIQPVFSEEIAPDKIPDMRDYDWEFLFVNDGSKDNTLSLLLNARNQDERINVLDLSRNFGKENAMLAGFDYANGDAVVIVDADLQHPLDVIPEMIKNWEEGYEDIYGKRAERGPEPLLRKWFSLTFYKLLQGSTRMEVLPNAGDFRLLDRNVINELKNLRETNRYTKGLYCWVGFKKKEIPFNIKERKHGKSTFNFFSLLNLAVEGLTSFSITPLRLSMLIGFVVSILAIIYIIVIIIKTLAFGEPVQGYPTLMCAILFLGGVQLISIGIIGEYIGRIFNESKNRPVYIISTINGKKK